MDDVHFRISTMLRDFATHQKILRLYLDKCNRYLTDDKKLTFSNNYKFLEVEIPESERHLSITTLSAGEKQIISLFSYLLANPAHTFVIIDEPELSLSMNWQEMLMDDIADFKVNGIFAATHSPFIVSPSFKYFTHGINEFKVK
jgi:predicted ATPase